MFNISYRKTGVIRFVKLGRLNISFCLSKPSALPGQWFSCGRPCPSPVLTAIDFAGLLSGILVGTAIWALLS